MRSRLSNTKRVNNYFLWYEQFSLPSVFNGTLADRLLEPCVKSTVMNAKHPAHDTNIKLETMRLMNAYLIRCPADDVHIVERVASLAKYAVAFFRMSRSSVTRVSSCFSRLISEDWSSFAAVPGEAAYRFIQAYKECVLTPRRGGGSNDRRAARRDRGAVAHGRCRTVLRSSFSQAGFVGANQRQSENLPTERVKRSHRKAMSLTTNRSVAQGYLSHPAR